MADWEDLTPRGSSGGWEDLQPKKSKERTWGEAATDIGAGVVSGAGALTQLPGQLYGLATGNFEDTGMLGAGKKLQQLGEEMKSAGLKAREEQRAQKIQEAEKTGQISAGWTALKETLKDPALLLSFLAEQAPQLLVPFGAAKAGAAVVGARQLAKGAAAEEAAALAGKAGAKTAIGAGAVQQGADVGAGAYEDIYKELVLKNVPEKEAAESALNLARASGASGAIISLLAQRLPGARTLEESFAGVPGTGGRAVGALKGALGESASEMVEETGGKFGQNLAMREVKPEQELTAGLGQTAGMAAIGGVGMGGVSGALQRPGQAPAEELAPPPAPIAEAPPSIEPPTKTPAPKDIQPPVTPPPAPTAEVKINQPELDALKNYTQGLPENAGDVFAQLQNRDRGTPASIQQMQGIAQNPDYDRLKTSADFGSGAPVVISDIELSPDQLGRVDTATASDGRKIPVQYAVIDANDLLASHTADGRTNEGYGDINQSAIRAVAGNGRIAGLQAAYNNNTATDYRSALETDNQHGIGTDVIQGMANPVLVRVMPKSMITPDIGDVSNVGGQLRLNPVEAAKNDGNRIDLGGLTFNEDGGVNTNSLIQFVRSMPKEEQGELIDKNGMPNSKAIDRLNNAIFYKAYGSDSLIDLYAQAADPEAKLILQALARAASKVSQLEGAGEYDIRQKIIEAAELAVNARRNGIKLKDYVQQGDIGMDPYARAILEMFAENGRSGKRMGELLGVLADEAAKQTKAGEDMFGNVPKASLDDVFKVLKEKPTEPDLFNQPKPTEPKQERPAQESKIFQTNKTGEQIEKDLTGKTINEVGQWLIDNAPNSVAEYIAEKITARINDMTNAGMKISWEVIEGNGIQGEHGSSTIKPGYPIEIVVSINNAKAISRKTGNSIAGTNYKTIMHELLHTATQPQTWVAGYLAKQERRDTSTLFKELTPLLTKIRRQANKDIKDGKRHAFLDKHRMYRAANKTNPLLKNVSELVSYGLTEHEFQDYLKTVNVGKGETAFSKLVDLFRQLLNIEPKYKSALEELARVTEAGLTKPFKELQAKIKQTGISSMGKDVSKSASVVEDTLAKVEKGAKDFLQKRHPFKPESFEGVKPDFMNGANKVFRPQKKTIIDRIEGMRDGFWRKVAQGMADQYRTIKDYDEKASGEGLKSNAYKLSRLSSTVDGALEGIMFHGHVFNDGGALNIKQGTKGLIDALKPLGKEVDRYQMWVALNREAQLPKEKRSSFIDKETGKDILPELVERRNELSDGSLDGKPRKQLYESVRKDMNALNKSVLKVALDAGVIDSTANAIERIREQIRAIKNNDAISDSKREVDIEELEGKIEDLRRNPIGYERFISDINYIPFYREMENGETGNVMTSTGLTNQQFSKALEGGESPFADLMENTLRNWSHILSASMKNQAAAATVDVAVKLGGAEPNLKEQYALIDGEVNIIKRTKDGESYEVFGDGKVKPWMTEQTKGSVKIMIDGQTAYYKILDPMLLESLTSMSWLGPSSKWLDVSRTLKGYLQYGVTLSPNFKVNNLFRDTIAAMAISGLKKTPIANVAQGWANSDRNNPAHISALAGGAIFNFGSAYEGNQAKNVKRLVEMGVPKESIILNESQIKNGLKFAWDKYQEWGNKSEAANRMALYTQMRDQGMSHLEASFEARDLLDFSMQGAWPAWRLITQVTPFLNARVQGLYKLGRDGIMPTTRSVYSIATGKDLWGDTEEGKRKKLTDQQKAASFSVVTMAVCFASLALYFAFKDDEDFKKRDQWDRDNFWWFKLPNMDYALRIPKPFEIGAFGTMAERVAEQMFDEGSEGKQFRDAMARAITNTFAFDFPQVVKPLLDLYSNKDSFTGAPIESAGMERLSKQARASDTTSPLAVALGGATQVLPEGLQLSPVQADYAVKAYFGWLGGTIASMSHYAVMPFKEGSAPDAKATDIVSLGFVKSLPSNQSSYVAAFYENNKQINQAMADMRHYSAIGQMEKVQQILEEKGDKVALAKLYDKTTKQMAKIREQISVVTNDESMDGATKREEIDRMKDLISLLAQQAESARKGLKQ